MQKSLLNLIYAQMFLNNISIEMVKEVEVAILAKMANIRQIVNKYSNELAEGPFWARRKWQKWQLIAKLSTTY